MNGKSDLLFGFALRGIGLVLAVGGTMTLYDTWRSAQPADFAKLVVGLASIFETLGGLVLLLGKPSERAWSWSVSIVAGLWAASIVQICLGRCTSGRFGSMNFNPWIALMFDLLAMLILFRGGQAVGQPSEFSASRLRLGGQVATAILIAFSGIWYLPPIAVSGVATFKGQPLEVGHLIFNSDSSSLVIETDHDGRFRLPPIRPGTYRVMIGGRPALPTPTPDPGDPASWKDSSSVKRQAIRTKVSRNSIQRPVEPVRPRGDAGILTWHAPPCCDSSISFHFVAGDVRRANGW